MGVQSNRFLDEDQEIKDKTKKKKKKNPWTLKCALEKTGDRLWKFKEVRLGTVLQVLEDFMKEVSHEVKNISRIYHRTQESCK